MRNLQRNKVVFRLAIVAALGAVAVGAHAQTANSQCNELRAKLEGSLNDLRATHMDLQRLKVILHNYENPHGGPSILPSTGLVIRNDDVFDRIVDREIRIEQLTQTAVRYRAEIKKCEGDA
jgi:hypothetical protein